MTGSTVRPTCCRAPALTCRASTGSRPTSAPGAPPRRSTCSMATPGAVAARPRCAAAVAAVAPAAGRCARHPDAPQLRRAQPPPDARDTGAVGRAAARRAGHAARVPVAQYHDWLAPAREPRRPLGDHVPARDGRTPAPSSNGSRARGCAPTSTHWTRPSARPSSRPTAEASTRPTRRGPTAGALRVPRLFLVAVR